MVLTSLRAHTEHLHRRVEAAVDIVGRVKTTDAYRALLARLYGFYEPFENRLATVAANAPLGLDLTLRRKVPLLEADLAYLGFAPDAVAALPRCGNLPDPKSVAEALGCLYVVEGATLGGQFIRRHAQKALGLSDDGVAFFSSYGAGVRAMWDAFCRAADSAVTTADQERQALAFAAETFEVFESWVAARGSDDGPAAAEVGA